MEDREVRVVTANESIEPRTRKFVKFAIWVFGIAVSTIPLFPIFVNLDKESYLQALLSFPDDGLTVFRMLMFMGAFFTLTVILWKTKRLARNNKQFSAIRVYLEQSMILSLLVVFGALTSQVYAPNHSLTSYFLEREKAVVFSRIKSVQGVEIEVRGCIQELKQLRCNLQISNKNDKRVIFTNLTSNKAYSFDGQYIKFEKAVFGGISAANRRTKKEVAAKSFMNAEIFFTAQDEKEMDTLKDLTIQYNFLEYKQPISFANVNLRHR